MIRKWLTIKITFFCLLLILLLLKENHVIRRIKLNVMWLFMEMNYGHRRISLNNGTWHNQSVSCRWPCVVNAIAIDIGSAIFICFAGICPYKTIFYVNIYFIKDEKSHRKTFIRIQGQSYVSIQQNVLLTIMKINNDIQT